MELGLVAVVLFGRGGGDLADAKEAQGRGSRDGEPAREGLRGGRDHVVDGGEVGVDAEITVGIEDAGDDEAGHHEDAGVRHGAGAHARVAADPVAGGAAVAHSGAGADEQAREDGLGEAHAGLGDLVGIPDAVNNSGGDEAAEEGEAPRGEISVFDDAFERAGDSEDAAGQEELADGGDAENAAADESRVGLKVEFDGHVVDMGVPRAVVGSVVRATPREKEKRF